MGFQKAEALCYVSYILKIVGMDTAISFLDASTAVAIGIYISGHMRLVLEMFNRCGGECECDPTRIIAGSLTIASNCHNTAGLCFAKHTEPG
jgi:hypothetical protein